MDTVPVALTESVAEVDIVLATLTLMLGEQLMLELLNALVINGAGLADRLLAEPAAASSPPATLEVGSRL